MLHQEGLRRAFPPGPRTWGLTFRLRSVRHPFVSVLSGLCAYAGERMGSRSIIMPFWGGRLKHESTELFIHAPLEGRAGLAVTRLAASPRKRWSFRPCSSHSSCFPVRRRRSLRRGAEGASSPGKAPSGQVRLPPGCGLVAVLPVSGRRAGERPGPFRGCGVRAALRFRWGSSGEGRGCLWKMRFSFLSHKVPVVVLLLPRFYPFLDEDLFGEARVDCSGRDLRGSAGPTTWARRGRPNLKSRG